MIFYFLQKTQKSNSGMRRRHFLRSGNMFYRKFVLTLCIRNPTDDKLYAARIFLKYHKNPY